MPPKKKFSEDQVVEAAFEIAKMEGMDSITIRKVAERLGSSIAPIYVNFDDVEALKHAVVRRIDQLSNQLISEQRTGSPFGDIGAATLQFAAMYPALIRDLIMKPNDYMQDYEQTLGPQLVAHMMTDPELAGLSENELYQILFKMRAFQTGLTVMMANGMLPAECDLQMMQNMLFSAAEDVVMAARMRNTSKS